MVRAIALLVVGGTMPASAACPGSVGEEVERVMANVPQAPKITFPHDSIDTLATPIAWLGEPQDACELRVGKTPDAEAADVWQSGRIDTADSCAQAPVLPGAARLYAFVRIHTSAGWSPWSAGSAFSTPDAPVVRIASPAHAGRAKGPDVAIAWQVESPQSVTHQSVSIDGGVAVDVPIGDRCYLASGLAGGVHGLKVSVTAGGRTGECGATFYVYKPVQQSASRLYTLDLRSLHQASVGDPAQAAMAFETLQIAAVLQGLVNRERAQLYILYTAVDEFWLGKMREKGGYLEHAQIVRLSDVEEAIGTFSSYLKGAVIWTAGLPCTNNIAATICGVEDLIPVRYSRTPGSFYDRLVRNGPRLKVARSLVGKFTGKGKIPGSDRDSTGSRKCDAYLWAKMHYLDTGKCNPREMGYWCDSFWLKHPRDMSLDNVGITNHDFIVARKGFICDLDVWPDETPRDDRYQKMGLDRETFREILLSCYKAANGRMIHVSGFTPWAIKYTTHGNAGGKHDGVPTEWEMAQLVSAYNGYVDADAIGYVGMANASVFSLCKLPDRLVQNPPPTRQDLEARGYIDPEGNVGKYNFVYHYLGDYDSAAWMYNWIPGIWRSSTRGQVPSGWAFNPSLIERLPIVFDWCYQTKSPNDYFVAGDSGAGYVNPTQLLPPRNPSGLPSAEPAWIEHNIPYFRQLNYSITAFLINGFCGELTDESNRMFLPFSGDGVMTQINWMPKGRKEDHLLDGMPVAGMKQDISAPIDVVVEAMLKHGRPNQTRFLGFRSILVDSEWIKTVNDRIREARPDCRFEPVDPYTYFYLLRQSLGGRNEQRATYTFDTMPDEAKPGQTVKVIAGLRNDGWDTWHASGETAVKLHASFTGRDGGVSVPLPGDIAPGKAAVVSFELQAPAEPGEYPFRLELIRGEDGWFGDAHDMPWEKRVAVR